MKVKKYLYVGLVAVLCIAIAFTTYFAMDANAQLAQLRGTPSAFGSAPAIFMPDPPTSGSAYTGASVEGDVSHGDLYYITDVSERFLDAFHTYDSSKPDEYEARYNGLITANGRSNMESELSRYTPADGRYVVQMLARKVYVQQVGDSDAKVFGLVYVSMGQDEDVDPERDNLPSGENPFMLLLNLKRESDGRWRVNSIQYINTLYGVPFELDKVFG